MSKLFLLLCIFIGFSKCDDYFRPFFENLLKYSRNATLNETCLKGDFDKEMVQVKEFAKNYEPGEMLVHLLIVVNHIKSECPFDEFKLMIAEITKKQKDETLYYILVKNIYNSVQLIVDEMTNPNMNSSTFGEAIGKAIYPFVKSENQTFLSQNIDFYSSFFSNYLSQEIKNYNKKRRNLRFSDTSIVWEVFAGIANGLAKDKSCLCQKSIMENQGKFVEVIKKVIQMIIEGEDFDDILNEIVKQLEQVKDIVQNCRILQLVDTIKETASIEGLTKLKERFFDKIGLIISAVASLIEAATNKQYGNIGVQIGKLIGILLDFYVN